MCDLSIQKTKLDIRILAVRDTEAQPNSDLIKDTTKAVLKVYVILVNSRFWLLLHIMPPI